METYTPLRGVYPVSVERCYLPFYHFDYSATIGGRGVDTARADEDFLELGYAYGGRSYPNAFLRSIWVPRDALASGKRVVLDDAALVEPFSQDERPREVFEDTLIPRVGHLLGHDKHPSQIHALRSVSRYYLPAYVFAYSHLGYEWRVFVSGVHGSASGLRKHSFAQGFANILQSGYKYATPRGGGSLSVLIYAIVLLPRIVVPLGMIAGLVTLYRNTLGLILRRSKWGDSVGVDSWLTGSEEIGYLDYHFGVGERIPHSSIFEEILDRLRKEAFSSRGTGAFGGGGGAFNSEEFNRQFQQAFFNQNHHQQQQQQRGPSQFASKSRPSDRETHLRALGLDPTSSNIDQKTIKSAFHVAIKKNHPDLATSEADKVKRREKTRQIIKARDYLLKK